MGHNQGGDGKGHSKFRTPEEDAAERRAAKQRRKNNRRGPHDNRPGDVMLFDGIREDRQTARDQLALEREFEATLGHLKRFGDQLIPGYSDMRPRWEVNAQAAAKGLLSLYFYGPVEEIEAQEQRMGSRIVAEVRRRFASACHFQSRIQDTAGQAQPWFEEALVEAKAFHEQRRAASRAARESKAPDTES